MKATSLLSLVSAVLASKVAAVCFSEALGYKCCENSEVVYTDIDGQWGIEDGNWCGIPINVETVSVEADLDEISSDDEVDVNVDEASIDVVEGSSTEEEDQINPAEYMSKLNVVNTCPVEASIYHEGVAYPTANKVYYYSTTTKNERPLNVILPVNYSEDKKYPVVYFLHGILCNEDTMLEEQFSTLQIPTNLFNEGKTKEFIMVLPNIYAPQDGIEFPAEFNQDYFDGYDNFINDLVDNIMPFIESNYSVATGKENTAICGFSMGGRNSLYIGYKRSDLFGYVGAFSPAPGVTPGTDFSGFHKGLFPNEDEFRTDNPPFVTLISCGTNDSVVGTFPKSYHEILTRNGQDHIWFEVPGADHDGPAVNAGLYNFISTVFGSLN